MPLRVIIIVFLFCLPAMGWAQQNETKQVNCLHRLLQKKMQDKLKTIKEPKSNDFLLLAIETDSLGYVSSVHIYTDLQNKGLSYAALSDLNKSEFASCKMPDLVNLTIIIPVICLVPYEDGDYIDDIFSDFFWPGLKENKTIVNRGKKSLITKTFIFNVFEDHRD